MTPNRAFNVKPDHPARLVPMDNLDHLDPMACLAPLVLLEKTDNPVLWDLLEMLDQVEPQESLDLLDNRDKTALEAHQFLDRKDLLVCLFF